MHPAAMILGSLNLVGIFAAFLASPHIGFTASATMGFLALEIAVAWFIVAGVLERWRQSLRQRDTLLERQAKALEELLRRVPSPAPPPPPPPPPPPSRAR